MRSFLTRLLAHFRTLICDSYENVVIRWILLKATLRTRYLPNNPYQRLRPHQLRVLTVFPPLTSRRDEPIQCSLETVSFEDCTAEYKDWEHSSYHSLVLQPRKARLAWIEHKRSNAAHRANDKRYPAREAFPEQAHDAARFEWGDYVALSYCWGKSVQETCRYIVLNGCFFGVTENLEAAIHFIRISRGLTSISPWRTKIWVDAICINQDDEPEKNVEIHRMKQIYGRSIGVFVHLGVEENDSGLGIDVLQRTAAEVTEGIDRGSYFLQNVQNPTEVDRKGYTALKNVLTRPYWNRLWILQELAMSDMGTAMGCGDRTFYFEDIILAGKFVWHNLENFLQFLSMEEKDLLTDHIALNRSLWVILFTQQLRALSQRLEDSESITHADLQLPLFNLSQNATAKEQHDKVYGLLAIMPEDIRLRMKAYTGYKLPVEAVFVAFSKAVIECTGDLDVIYSNSFQQTTVPSWVTDWRFSPLRVSLLHDWHTYGYNQFNDAYTNLHYMVNTARTVRADGGRKAAVEFLDNSTTLTCSGFLIGEVDGMASEMPTLPTTERVCIKYSDNDHIQPKSQCSPYGDESATKRAIVHTMFANPVWGDSEEASLFSIPWLSGDDYITDPANPYYWRDDWKEKARAMYNSSWNSIFHFGFLSFEIFRRRLGYFRLGGKRFQDYFVQEISECSIPPDRLRLDLAKVMGGHLGRRLITLSTGHFGLAPHTIEPGDGIYVLLGCSLPVVLRQIAGNSHYRVIGECYVEGFASGEAIPGLDDGTFQLQDLALC
ncbi:HET-domain-containing protein [Lentithecium fluviatile CBS 122367]|uniref:HET-domain-containing protein n=1 Tax=Lentithecium fluviatile CBS 122367 TaxID=1168545 RepID=A0A6G1IN88_9PLEO|nr:HET-domain-containing protein [Lentithecium fluviatile CBS 122367]